jgi:hypothetical protein
VHRTLNALLGWLDRLQAGTAPVQLGPFVRRYGDETVQHEVQRLERLVATGSQEAWDATPLLRGMNPGTPAVSAGQSPVALVPHCAATTQSIQRRGSALIQAHTHTSVGG